MRINKNIVFVGGMCVTIGIYALSGYFGFPMESGIVSTTITAIAALSTPESDNSKEE